MQQTMQPQLFEITDPGYYVIKDGEVIEIATYDEDREDALRILALRLHLDDFTSPMVVGCDHHIEVNPHTKWHGMGPDDAVKRCKALREALTEAACPVPVRVPPHNGTGTDFSRVIFGNMKVDDLRREGYDTLRVLLQVHNPKALTKNEDLLNSLYFLMGDKNDIGQTMCEAWDDLEVKDRRTSFETCDSEWLVLTDLEADEAWDRELDNYIDDCLEIPDNIRMYFDVCKWKNDARMDGRGHALSTYNGCEDSVYLESEDETLFLFRCN